MSILHNILIDGKNHQLAVHGIFIRFSTNSDGSDFADIRLPEHKYIGFAVGEEAPKDKSGYFWIASAEITNNGGSEDVDAPTISGVWKLKDSYREIYKDPERLGPDLGTTSVEFTSNGIKFNGIRVEEDTTYFYRNGLDQDYEYIFWQDDANEYTVLDFGSEPQEVTKEFVEWIHECMDDITPATISGKWFFNEQLEAYDGSLTQEVEFTIPGTVNGYGPNLGGMRMVADSLYYFDDDSDGEVEVYGLDADYEWLFGMGDIARNVDFGEEPQQVSNEFFAYMQRNATKQ